MTDQYWKSWRCQVPDHPGQVPDTPGQLPDQGGQEPDTPQFFFQKILV